MKPSLKFLATFAIGSIALAALAQQPTPTPAPPLTQSQLLLKLDDFAGLPRYAAANATLAPMEKDRVVFFGDSITDAWVRNGGTFFPGKPYLNRGISGQTTPQMLVRFRQDVLNLHPVAVIILAGTNDIAGNTGPSTLEMIEDNLISMAELARANHIRVILASVLPAADYPWRKGLEPAPKIKALNQWMQSYCAEKKFTYLDYYAAMADENGGMKPGISIDGVHPNAAGYAIMEPLAQKAIDLALHN
jgi:lysophospholipase L1-like esterase